MKNKYVEIGGTALVVLALAGGSFWWWHGHDKTQKLNDGAASIDAENTADQTSTTDNSGSDLSVTNSSQATDLGQLTGSQKSSGSSNSGGITTQGNSTSSNSGSSSSSPIDPSTFSQYDKYQNETSALFGDITVGSGTALTSGHQASVYYKGWLTNGSLFDESKTDSNGQPQAFTFTEGANQVITGWEQGMAGMKVGGTRLIIVPPSVGYGSQAQGSIPANSVLVFEVQLLAVQ